MLVLYLSHCIDVIIYNSYGGYCINTQLISSVHCTSYVYTTDEFQCHTYNDFYTHKPCCNFINVAINLFAT